MRWFDAPEAKMHEIFDVPAARSLKSASDELLKRAAQGTLAACGRWPSDPPWRVRWFAGQSAR